MLALLVTRPWEQAIRNTERATTRCTLGWWRWCQCLLQGRGRWRRRDIPKKVVVVVVVGCMVLVPPGRWRRQLITMTSPSLLLFLYFCHLLLLFAGGEVASIALARLFPIIWFSSLATVKNFLLTHSTTLQYILWLTTTEYGVAKYFSCRVTNKRFAQYAYLKSNKERSRPAVAITISYHIDGKVYQVIRCYCGKYFKVTNHSPWVSIWWKVWPQ